MKVIKNFINYINESSDSDKKLIDKIFRILPASRKTVDWDHRGRLYLPSVNGEDSKVHILSRADMAEWESDFMEMYGETPRYKVELTDTDQEELHHINDVKSVTVEITNGVFKEKKDRFSRGKSKFLNDPDFRNSSKD